MSESTKRFWSKIARGKVDDCWEWLATKSKKGYGQFRLNGQMRFAHRVAYVATNGEIPKGLTIDHLCKNRACVNPSHLEAVSQGENARRGLVKTHCKNGHPRTTENINRVSKNCKLCRKMK